MAHCALAIVRVKPERLAEFVELSQAIVDRSTSENGTVYYRIVKTKGAENEYCIWEEFEDETASKLHHESEPHLLINSRMKELLAEESVYRRFEHADAINPKK